MQYFSLTYCQKHSLHYYKKMKFITHSHILVDRMTGDFYKRRPHRCFACEGQIDGLVQERRNSIANALALHLSCTNSSICGQKMTKEVVEFEMWHPVCQWTDIFPCAGVLEYMRFIHPTFRYRKHPINNLVSVRFQAKLPWVFTWHKYCYDWLKHTLSENYSNWWN